MRLGKGYVIFNSPDLFGQIDLGWHFIYILLGNNKSIRVPLLDFEVIDKITIMERCNETRNSSYVDDWRDLKQYNVAEDYPEVLL